MGDTAAGLATGGSLLILASDWFREDHVTQSGQRDMKMSAPGLLGNFSSLLKTGHALHVGGTANTAQLLWRAH